MHVEGAYRTDQHGDVSFKSLCPATMSKNFSAPKSVPNPPSVTTKSASLRATRVARIELLPWAMLAKGPPWIEGGLALECLHQIGFDRVLKQRCHGALGFEVTGVHGSAVMGVRHQDSPEPLSEVVEVGGEAEDGHDFGGYGDVESALSWHAVLIPPSPETTLRSCRSLISRTRRKITRRGSMLSALPWKMWLSIIAARRLWALPTAP